MPNYNKAILMGRLTRDPDFRITPSGQPKANTAVAVNHDWIDQQAGEKRSTVCFMISRPLAETPKSSMNVLKKDHQFMWRDISVTGNGRRGMEIFDPSTT